MFKSLIVASFALVAGIAFNASSASAQGADCTKGRLVFNGNDAVGFEPTSGCPGMVRNLTFKNVKPACPHGFVILESRKADASTGGVHTREQRDRGDQRVHFKCDWSRAQSGTASVTAPPAQQGTDVTSPVPNRRQIAPAQPQFRTPNPNRVIPAVDEQDEYL